MSDNNRPNIVGKGPSISREMLDIFKEVEAGMIAKPVDLPDETADLVRSVVIDRGRQLGELIRGAYLKTVKGSEVAWDCKQMAIALKNAITTGNPLEAESISQELIKELDNFINKIRTFVVRMT